jgi:hypothetical protein
MAFPMIGLDWTVAAEMKPRTDMETGAIGAAQLSDANEPGPEVTADE